MLAQRAGAAHRVEQGLVRVERLVLLGIIAGLDAGPEDDLARVGLFQAQDQAQQHRFARAVRADQPHPLAVPDEQVDALQRPAGPKGFVHPFDLQHLVRAAPAVQLQRHAPALQHRLLDAVNALDALLDRLAAAGRTSRCHRPAPRWHSA